MVKIAEIRESPCFFIRSLTVLAIVFCPFSYRRNFYKEVTETNRVHYEYYNLGMAGNVPKLQSFHFHTLRHTYTTNLLSNEAQTKDVQELLGHSDVSTTLNVYVHATRRAKRNSEKLLDKVVGMKF